MDASIVAIAGEKQSGKKALWTRLRETAAPDAEDKLRLETKYYSASLRPVILRSEEEITRESPHVSKSEAIVLVFNSSEEDSFEFAKNLWKNNLENCMSPELKLLVANKIDSGEHGKVRTERRKKASEQQEEAHPENVTSMSNEYDGDQDEDHPLLARAFDWAFDEGFEVVFISCVDPTLERYATVDSLATFEAGEKVGIDRMVESMQSTLWSTMQMKKEAKKAPVAVAVGADEDNNCASHVDAKCPQNEADRKSATKGEEEREESSIIEHSQTNMSESSQSSAAQEAKDPLYDMVAALADQRSTSQSGHTSTKDGSLGDDLDGFSHIIDTMRKTRELAQNKKELSDKDRRENAVRVTLQMMQLLGIEDSEDDEDGA